MRSGDWQSTVASDGKTGKLARREAVQLIHRQSFRHPSIEEDSHRVLESNEFLAAVCDTDCIRFWKHKGMCNSLQIIFSGAHFNDLGPFPPEHRDTWDALTRPGVVACRLETSANQLLEAESL